MVWPEAGISHSQGIPPDFYPPYVKVGLSIPSLPLPLCLHATPSLPVSMTPPFLPMWMNVAYLSLWLSDFHTAQFSDGFGCYSL